MPTDGDMLPHEGMRRALLLRDGTAIGVFTRRRHETHTIVLEPNGHSYTHVGPSGRATRHLSPTALTSHITMVEATLGFRNRFARCSTLAQLTPYLRRSLLDPSRSRWAYHRRGTMATARWPAGEYHVSSLWSSYDRLLAIESVEGAARVQLHASGLLVRVFYFVEIRPIDSGERTSDASAAFELVPHTLVEQEFALCSTPECFAFPVTVLLKARHAQATGLKTFQLGDGVISLSSKLPSNSALDAKPSFRPLHTSTGSDPSTALDDTLLPIDAVVRLIHATSSPTLHQATVVDWNEATLFLVTADTRPTILMRRCDVWDDAHEKINELIECDRGFFRVFDTSGSVVQRFTSDAAPIRLEACTIEFERLQRMVNHASRLLQIASRVAIDVGVGINNSSGTEQADAADTGPTQLVEATENQIGRFRAFSDGRVRVIFADRTIVQVVNFGVHCSFVHRDGSCTECTNATASPNQREYLRVALDFAEWAFASPAQRFRSYQQQQHGASRVARELQQIAVRYELNQAEPGGGLVDSRSNATQRNSQSFEAPCGAAELSLEAIRKLQDETQRHLSRVSAVLNASSAHTDGR